VLNKQLPDDIRILDWAFVPEDFSARFSCSSRLYNYFFSKLHFDSISNNLIFLDIGKMREAAKLLIGVHDFRNFCRKDPSKPNQCFVREIIDCQVIEIEGSTDFYMFSCRGSAFLYHQIRCIMAILFRIGCGIEPVELIEAMLAIVNSTNSSSISICGPLINYEIASGVPLTLRECFYEKQGSDPINWTLKNQRHSIDASHIARLWECKQAEAFIIKGLLNIKPDIGNFSFQKNLLLDKLNEIAK
jgi:tRNA pseudouridine38/39 synthase